jgi:hypothetical protein
MRNNEKGFALLLEMIVVLSILLVLLASLLPNLGSAQTIAQQQAAIASLRDTAHTLTYNCLPQPASSSVSNGYSFTLTLSDPCPTNQLQAQTQGTPVTATLVPQDVRPPGAWGDLYTSSGPSVSASISSAGFALATLTATAVSTNGQTCAMGLQVSGASNAAPSLSNAMQVSGQPGTGIQSGLTASSTFLLTGLTAGTNTFTAKYLNTGNSDCLFSNKSLMVVPLGPQSFTMAAIPTNPRNTRSFYTDNSTPAAVHYSDDPANPANATSPTL